MEDDPVRDPSGAIPDWLVRVRERMRGEVADLLDEEGRLQYDPEAPDAAETGARILHAFGRAAVDEMAEALRGRLLNRPAEAPPDLLGESDFRKELGEVLQGVLQELLEESRRGRGEGPAASRRGKDGRGERETRKPGRKRRS